MREPTTDDIDARSEELMKEFSQHKDEVYSEIRSTDPELLNPDGSLDERRIFEGWCIQKLAGVQVILEHLNRQQGLGS